jgi:hypothetical protein
MQDAEGMKRSNRVPGQAFLGMVLVFAMCGCGTVHRSRIVLDSWGRIPDGTVVSNFSVDEVDSFVRSFALQRGYDVKFADSSHAWAEEAEGDDASLLWMAEKPGDPVILFISTDKELVVTLIGTAGLTRSPLIKEYTNVIYRMLADKFGEENVHLVY